MPEIDRVRVELADRAYDILVGSGLLADAGQTIRATLGGRRLIVITDANVAALHLPALEASLAAAGLGFESLVVPAGEASKDIHKFPALLERVLDLGIDRRTVLVAFGGGVVGDLVGFAAASLLRGLDFVQIPTSLLAQIDSSVGGKTGVNTRQGKNLVGAFHQPLLVLADLDMLATLPRRELLAGYAEMVKYGLLGDAAFFAELEGKALPDLPPAAFQEAVAHCCRMKAEIVAEDERESGRRALLNYGHTFGHALEAETGFGQALLHGEGVGLGMVLAAELSVRLGRLTGEDSARVQRHLAAVGLPTRLGQLQLGPAPEARLVAHMAHDKKTADGVLTFILLDGIGHATVQKGIDAAIVRDVLAAG